MKNTKKIISVSLIFTMALFTSINTTKALFGPSGTLYFDERDKINWTSQKAENLMVLMQTSKESTEAIQTIQKELQQQKTQRQDAIANINKITNELKAQEVTTAATIAQWPILTSTFPADTPALSSLKSLLEQDIKNIKMDLERIRQSIILLMKKQQEALTIINK